MDVFSCRVRPGGHIFHEVNKYNVTAAEVEILRHVHNGAESVVGLVKTGTVNAKPREEYVRLTQKYGAEKVKEFYGPMSSARLPDTIEDDFEDETVAAEPAKPAKRGRGKAAHAAPVSDAADGLNLDDDDND